MRAGGVFFDTPPGGPPWGGPPWGTPLGGPPLGDPPGGTSPGEGTLRAPGVPGDPSGRFWDSLQIPYSTFSKSQFN